MSDQTMRTPEQIDSDHTAGKGHVKERVAELRAGLAGAAHTVAAAPAGAAHAADETVGAAARRVASTAKSHQIASAAAAAALLAFAIGYLLAHRR